MGRINRNGLIVWEGASRFDRQTPIAVILTGFHSKSANDKTGGMLQSWILPRDENPWAALRAGRDTSICGDCKHRSIASGGAGTCYVRVYQAPHAVWNCYARGGYARVSIAEASERVAASGRHLRIGSYGDPAMAPPLIWRKLTRDGLHPHTGYSHQWRKRIAEGLRGIAQASVDDHSEAREAWRKGWATFRVAPLSDPLRLAGEARCPASAEAGRRVTCETCPIACDGATRRGIKGRVIFAHGARRRSVK